MALCITGDLFFMCGRGSRRFSSRSSAQSIPAAQLAFFMESLKKNADFKNCYNTGRSYVNKYLVLYVCGNGLEKNRVGISVSKKVGNSVVRHRTTRLVRESYRLHEQEFISGRDLVFVARVRSKEAGFFEIERALLQLMKKAGIRDSYAENDKKNND